MTTRALREPDLTGLVSRAWRARAGDEPGACGMWFVDAPASHPIWPRHAIGMCHLREERGLPAAVKRAPDATHELLVVALDPDHYPPDPDVPRMAIRYLRPPDVSIQLAALTDALARELVDLCAKAVCDGALIPDQDYRAVWNLYIAETVACARTGHQGQALAWPADARMVG